MLSKLVAAINGRPQAATRLAFPEIAFQGHGQAYHPGNLLARPDAKELRYVTCAVEETKRLIQANQVDADKLEQLHNTIKLRQFKSSCPKGHLLGHNAQELARLFRKSINNNYPTIFKYTIPSLKIPSFKSYCRSHLRCNFF